MLESLFMRLFAISITTSVVVFFLKLFSGMFNKTYAAKWKYWIWLVLALRLVIPFNFSLPATPVTVNIPNTPMGTFANTATVQQNANRLPAETEQDMTNIPEPLTQTNPFTMINVLMLLWVIGIALFLIYQWVGYLLFKKKALRWSKEPTDTQINNRLREISRDMRLKKEITVRISKGISSPLMTGFSRPLLFLPEENYSNTDLNFILYHELTHYQRRDIWYKLFLMVVNAIHWFNPFIYLMFHEASADLELSCDDRVIKGFSNDERRMYSETILASIAEQKSHKMALSTYFHGGQKTMKSRFENIFNTKKKRNGMIALLAVMLTVGILGGLIACNVDVSENRLLTKLGYTKTLVKDILDRKTTLSQDNENIEEIIESLPLQAYRRYESFSVQTEPSKEINIVYKFDDSYTRGGNGIDPFPGIVEENNALLLFAAVEGLEKINFSHYDEEELNYTNSYIVDSLTPRFGEIEPLNMEFTDLYHALWSNIQLSEFYFAHYARIYLSVEPERVSYRNGEPDEIRQQSDGSTVWIYGEFGKIYNISPDGSINDDPSHIGIYYFNSPMAEKNDQLTGLYATRFIHADNHEKTYDEIIEVLGLPTTIKDMEGGDQYIAYALSEGQQRHAYFIFHKGKVIEEGVMYGTDYTILDYE